MSANCTRLSRRESVNFKLRILPEPSCRRRTVRMAAQIRAVDSGLFNHQRPHSKIEWPDRRKESIPHRAGRLIEFEFRLHPQRLPSLANGSTGPFRLIEIPKQHHRYHEIRRGPLGELNRIDAFVDQDQQGQSLSKR